MTHPGVLDAAVIGIPDEAAGELPRAFVVRKPESTVKAEEIFDFVKGRFAWWLILDSGMHFFLLLYDFLLFEKNEISIKNHIEVYQSIFFWIHYFLRSQ